MDLVFPLKPQTAFLKVPSSSALFLPLPFKSLRLRPVSATSKKLRVHCELESRVNGAISGDFDPRFVDRQKALEAAMNDINNSFGKGSVTRLGSAGGALVETFPSGCLTLDCALGGGLPKGRIVEIFGPESSGKTTIALHAIAEVQKLGGNAMLVDAEHAFDPAYSKSLGVDVENLIVCQPDHGEMALEIADRMCRSGAVDLICVDSVSALTPRAEIEGEIGMQQMGLQARLMSQALRKMSGNASKAGCTLIFLNQIRYKIGVYYGNPEVTSGGIALKFFASVRLEVRPIGKIKSAKGDEEIGLKVRARVQKSKVSRPYKIAEFEIIFGEGVSKLGCILDCAEILDIVLKKGSWYSYGDHRLGQGREKAIQYLKENTHILEEIEKVVRSSLVEGTNQTNLAFTKSGPVLHQDDDIFDEEVLRLLCSLDFSGISSSLNSEILGNTKILSSQIWEILLC
ncbi:DNA repair protein recA homolog 1, chloroplastic isoform X1 [Arachis stenosperma]|uniref:DNA repair protein recA homolog 1, chloroplastic isoform X1 n=1 Tax=Arachis stenosperma TaxID=217475 RepID=UPI0025ABF8AA|nr:DNA repair protein recA homolog 1, chloroplastic isoform X1 [Arachis stenosperma]